MTWNKWVLALLGLVVLAVPFLNLTAMAIMWTSVVVGVLIIAMSLWSLAGVTDESTSSSRRFQHNS